MNPETSATEVRLALGKQSPIFRHAAAFSAVIGLLMLAPSFYMLEVYDRVVNSRSVMTLAMLTILLALGYVVLGVLQWARQGVLRQAAEGFDATLGERVYGAVFQANLRGARGLGLRGLRDFNTIRDFICSAIVAGVMDIPMALLLVGVIFWIDPVLGWFGLGSAALQGVITFFNKQSADGPLAKANNLASQAQNFVEASLKNGEVVQAMGMADGLRQRWLKMQRELLRHQAVASDRAGIFTALSKYVQLVSSSLMLGLGAWLLISGNFVGSAGLVLMASILAGRALAPLVQVIMGWRNVVAAREAYARLTSLLENIPATEAGLPLPAPKGRLSVEGITARAPGMAPTSKPVLRNVTFDMPPGKMLVVVGPSASGKSSLSHMLVGAWPCLAGTVRLDGVDMFAWNKLELGPHVGFLPQDVALFDGTVAQNIARFGELDHTKIKMAAKITGLHKLIKALPQGYSSRIGDDGVVLSGGMRQRIGLARAIYGFPRLVVLDEPNANLDEAGDAALMHTLQVLRSAGVSVVVMSHRKNLLAMADLMLIMMDGESKAFGPPAAIIKALEATPVAKQRLGSLAQVTPIGSRAGSKPVAAA
jgi:ATP-binding cassette subfamily C exporter for protease/lipase